MYILTNKKIKYNEFKKLQSLLQNDLNNRVGETANNYYATC